MINVTPAAASKISELLVEENKAGSGLRGLWQRGHSFTAGAEILCCARRLSRRALEVLFFGTAIGRAS